MDRAGAECAAWRFGAWLPSVRLPVFSHQQLQNWWSGGGGLISVAVPGEAACLRGHFQFGAGGGGNCRLCAYCAAGCFPRSARRQHDIFRCHLGVVLGAGPLLLPPDLGFSCVLRMGKSLWRARGNADLDAGKLRADNARGQAGFRDGRRGRHCGRDFCRFPLQNHGQEVRNGKPAAGHDAVRFNLRRAGDFGLAHRPGGA